MRKKENPWKPGDRVCTPDSCPHLVGTVIEAHDTGWCFVEWYPGETPLPVIDNRLCMVVEAVIVLNNEESTHGIEDHVL